ncbi:hypothetical protein ANN_08327 [Periplaneta americana]|uniref:Uncharacterized protein n=1 Tax=Periplaneta americana TaxID=6978 RepID=A0ABQ8T143_PERAM|nr:hypothetical protein ANN_08327 [Periplaneta americana]
MGSTERGADAVKRWFRSEAADFYDTKIDPMEKIQECSMDFGKRFMIFNFARLCNQYHNILVAPVAVAPVVALAAPVFVGLAVAEAFHVTTLSTSEIIQRLISTKKEGEEMRKRKNNEKKDRKRRERRKLGRESEEEESRGGEVGEARKEEKRKEKGMKRKEQIGRRRRKGEKDE